MKGFLIFITIALTVYAMMNFAAYWWLRFMFRPAGVAKTALLSGIICLSATFIAGRFLTSTVGGFPGMILLQTGYIWLGYLFYFFVLGIFTALLVFTIRLLHTLNWIQISDSILTGGFPITGTIILGILTASAVYGAFMVNQPVVNRFELQIANKSDTPITIVQLSDLHLNSGKSVDWWKTVVEKTNAQKPDLIALTGDVFDENHDELAPFLPALAQLTATWGVYAVTGNHEFYADTEDGLKSLESAGVKVLRNDVEVIPEIAVVVGLDDPTGIQAAKLARPDFNRLKSRIPAGLPVIVLNHQPVYLEQVQAMGGDLQLSGHTHDGQIWPFKYLNKLVFKYQNGLHKLGDLFLYVSSGTGYWGPPFRIGTTSEITVFYLNS